MKSDGGWARKTEEKMQALRDLTVVMLVGACIMDYVDGTLWNLNKKTFLHLSPAQAAPGSVQ